MEKIDILLWIMSGGFSLMLVMWYSLSSRMDRLEDKDDRLAEKIEDVDRRLCRIEGSLATQGHCLFQQGQQEKKAE